MGKITEYPKVTSLTNDNVFLLDGPTGTKGIIASDLKKAMSPDIIGNMAAEMHRMTFRGKNLGSTVTAAQKEAISNGSFDDIYVGDYWLIGGVTWRIADIDYWLNCGDVNFTRHHLVIVPDGALYNAVMNPTNVTTGAYVGSQMRTANLEQAKTLAANAFGSMVLTHREYLSNAVTAGYPSQEHGLTHRLN